ncbi:MAG TPA: DUF6498-containing protein [Lacibacter sp.]|nr:DUF6498-containing protein [Lacibacter sp.]HMO89105.1 DUF6498-containing protein [Lacibacter sp.]HMP85800.1 DUF6498-containing protein [Lacibacter sp.]
MKRLTADPGFWILLLFNCYLMGYYIVYPDSFGTIIWIFWLQSVLIGVFTFLDLLTIRNPDPKSMSINGKPVGKSQMGCSALFFLFHYGVFHLIYGIILLTEYGRGTNFKVVLLSGAAFLLEGTRQFVLQRRARKRGRPVDVGKLFFTPYLRIIPMHLTILLPSFLGIATSIIFLLFKTVADLGMYLLTSDRSPVSSQSLTHAAQEVLRKLAKK